MPFKRPTLKELDERIRNDIAGAVRVASKANRAAALLRRSVVGVISRVYAGACHMLYAFLDWLAKQRFVHSMDDEFLDSEGAMYAMPRKGASGAEGKLLITGTNGSAVLIGAAYLHDDGREYRVTEMAVIADGQASLSVAATTPGAVGNLSAGEKLKSSMPLNGIDSEAVVDEDGIAGGTEIESDELYRERILDRKRQPPHGGAAHDYVAWAKEVRGVTRAWCLPLWMGEGTVGVMFARDYDEDPIPTEEQCKEVWNHIEKVRPVTAEVFVFPPVRKEVDITVKLSPDRPEIREAVSDEFDDFLFRDGKPDTYLRVSRISEAVSTATGEHHHYLIEPSNDIHVPKNALPVRGKIIYVDNLEG